MENNIKINIAGIIFHISGDGYDLLRDYLQSINNRLKNISGGNEMIEDIEARIAEIFQTEPSWKTAVISKEDVEAMIATMGSPEEIAGDFESESSQSSYQSSDKKLFRNSSDSVIGGVCSGLADYLRIEAVWVRIAFVIFSLVYLIGALVYVILWIALPTSTSPRSRKQTTKSPPAASQPAKAKSETIQHETAVQKEVYIHKEKSDNVGNAFNEVFKAFGKFFIILFRVIIAIIGVSFIISGFSILFSYIIIAFFNSSVFMSNIFDTTIFYLPDFLSFIVNPSLAVWLIIITSLVIILPLLAMIYWGIRMVFQFRVKDLVLNLAMLIIWILSCTALALLLFSEGISFSNSGRIAEQMVLSENDTIYVELDERIHSIDYDREVHLPFEEFGLYLDESSRTIYGTPEVDIYPTDEEAYIEIIKYSNGKTRNDAMGKADKLEYSYHLDENILYLNEYFSIPEGNRWSGAYMKIKIYLPEGKIIFFEEEIEGILDDYLGNGVYAYEAGNEYWRMTEDGIEKIN